MRSIRTKIVAITVAAILTSILSVILACSSTVQAENDRRSVEMMNLLDRSTQRVLEDYFTEIGHAVEMAAGIAYDSLNGVLLAEFNAAGASSSLSERPADLVEMLDRHLAEQSLLVREAFDSVADHIRGVEAYYYCISPELSRTEHGFFYRKAGRTGFERMPPLDAGKLDLADPEENAWYFTPVRNGRPSWVGPYRSELLGDELICSYVAPVYKSGALIGVLGMDLLFDALDSNVRSIRIFDSGYACLLDAEGRILSHPELPYGSTLAYSGLPEDLLRLDGSGDRLLRYTAGGQRRQFCFSTLSNGMKLLISAPMAEITASWTRLIRIILLVTAVSIAAYAALASLALGILTRPLKTLTEASGRLADGDYDTALDYRGRDEVGALTEAFLRMRDRLKDYIADLNRRVLTDDLTGLPNMRYFFLLAEEERKRQFLENRHPVMIYFNLIGMKH